MNIMHTFRPKAILATLLLCLAASTASFAAIGTPVVPAIKGTIQNIDYVHHAITVNGATYAVASNAKFSGVAGFSILHVGMPIAYTLGSSTAGTSPGVAGSTDPGPASADPPVITSVTWLPD